MNEDIKSRIEEIRTRYRLGINKFETLCGLSHGYLFNLKSEIGSGKLSKILAAFPDVNPAWLLTGEGEMLKSNELAESGGEVSPVTETPRGIPLYALEAVAGFVAAPYNDESIEGYIQWFGAQDGDVAVHIHGDSMSPRIPHGSIVLVRPYAFTDFEDLAFGRVHIVVTVDGKAMLKLLRYDRDHPGRLLLCSYNEAYPPRSIDVKDIRRLFLAVSYQAPL